MREEILSIETNVDDVLRGVSCKNDEKIQLKQIYTKLVPLIQQAIQENAESKVLNENYVLIQCKRKYEDQKEEIFYYLVDQSICFGKGKFGRVYLAWLIEDPIKGKCDFNHPCAVKVFNDGDIETITNEAEFFFKLYWAERPVKVGNQVFLVMQYLPGEKLFAEKEKGLLKKAAFLSKVSFTSLLSIVTQLACDLNILHHEKPETGEAIVHLDIKGSNIRVEKINKDLIRTYLTDFGVSIGLETEESTETMDAGGSVYNISPERLRHMYGNQYAPGKVGTKNDVYGFVPIILGVFGATKPYVKRDRKTNQEVPIPHVGSRTFNADLKRYAEAKFNREGFLENIDLPETALPLRPLLEKFLDRMEIVGYEERANTDEVLRFFTTLNHLTELYHEKEEDHAEEINTCAAKMALLAGGLWRENIGTKEIAVFKKVELGKSNLILLNQDPASKTFEQFDFEAHPEVTQAIVCLAEKSLLTKEIAVALIKDTQAAESVLALHEKNLLSVPIVNVLINRIMPQITLNKISINACIHWLKNYASHRASFECAFGKKKGKMICKQQRKEILAIVLKDIETYHTAKKADTSLFNLWKGWIFSYTPEKKVKATEFLMDKVKKIHRESHLIGNFFESNKKILGALKQGNLGKKSAILLDALTENRPSPAAAA